MKDRADVQPDRPEMVRVGVQEEVHSYRTENYYYSMVLVHM